MNNNDVLKQEAVINDEIHRLLQRIQSQNRLPQGITKDILLATANVFCAMVFGSRYELDNPEFIRIVEIGSGLFTMLVNGFLVDVLPWLKFFPFKSIQIFQELCKDRDEIFGRIYREHVEANRLQIPRNLTDALLKARDEAEEDDSNKGIITDQHIIVMMYEIFPAALMNIANTLCWALLYLTRNPDVQQMLHQELDQVVGSNRLPALEDKKSLPFLEATITEPHFVHNLFLDSP